MSIKQRDKSYRGNASQFFVAGELCRRGHPREHPEHGHSV